LLLLASSRGLCEKFIPFVCRLGSFLLFLMPVFSLGTASATVSGSCTHAGGDILGMHANSDLLCRGIGSCPEFRKGNRSSFVGRLPKRALDRELCRVFPGIPRVGQSRRQLPHLCGSSDGCLFS